MDPIPDSVLTRWVIERGLISPERLRCALEAQAAAAEPTPLSRILLDGGDLTPEDLRAIQDTLEDAPTQSPSAGQAATPSLASVTQGYSSPGVPPPLPSQRAESPGPEDEAPNFGKYRLFEEVGRGGMGVVYRALDTQLRREVAIKTLREAERVEPELLARLVREARIVATLEHPGIVPVHDVGRVGDVAFYAMGFVRGLTLDRHLAKHPALDSRERAVLVQRAAEAVAHAHDRRVVHRDLKPTNLIVDPAGAVHVMDFGLAKSLDEASRLTTPGEVLGTAVYMPPEQIEGDNDQVGPAADVYALGAVLYEALTGHPPFHGRSFAQIAVRVIQRAPRPPRKWDRGIPVDLETICLKALQKTPERRYPSARELAEDLGRFAAGEAIRARPETGWEKTTRWMKRHPLLCSLMAAIMLTGGLAGFMAWRAAVARSDRAQLAAEKLDALRTGAALAVDGALAVRRAGGAVSVVEAKFGAALEGLARKAISADPARGEPHFYLARFHGILNRDDEALAALDTALAAEPGFAPAWYARAVLSMERYFLAVAGSDRERGERPDADAGKCLDAARESLDRLEEILARDDSWIRHPVALLRLGAARTAAEGVRMILRDEDARPRLLAALQEDPELEEPRIWLIWDSKSRGRLTEALELADAGVKVDRGNVRLRLARAHVHNDMAAEAARTGGAGTRTHLRAAIDECGTILELDPRCLAALRARARAWQRLGADAGERREDDTEFLASSVRDCESVLKVHPGSVQDLSVLGRTHLHTAMARFNRQLDPGVALAAARAAFDELLRVEPASALGWGGCAEIEYIRGLALSATPADPSPAFRSAIAAADRTLELDPEWAGVWRMRAECRLSLALRVASDGVDGEILLRAALDDMAIAVRAGAEDPLNWVARGRAACLMAENLRERGSDPTEVLQTGIESLDRALKIHPDLYLALEQRSACWRGIAAHETTLGRDPGPTYQRALDDADRCVQADPQRGEGWAERGAVRGKMLGWLLAAGRELPEDLYRAAVHDLEEAIRRVPGHSYFRGSLGRICITWCWYRWGKGEDPGEEYPRALATLDVAARQNPGDSQMPYFRGSLRARRILAHAGRGPIPDEEFARTFADFDLALRLSPSNALLRYNRASTWMLWARQQEAAGRSPLSMMFCVNLELESAIQRKPDEAEWRAELERWGRPLEANAPELLEKGRGSPEWWQHPLRLADDEFGQGRAAAARMIYVEGLRRAEQSGAASDPLVRDAHYKLACAFARGTGAADRDEAFTHLERALELGRRDADHLEKDPNLESLHADPRWPVLVGRAR